MINNKKTKSNNLQKFISSRILIPPMALNKNILFRKTNLKKDNQKTMKVNMNTIKNKFISIRSISLKNTEEKKDEKKLKNDNKDEKNLKNHENIIK